MLGRFTDNARAVVQESLHRNPTASERDILTAIAGRPRGLATQLLATAGVAVDDFRSDGILLDRPTLVAEAVAEAQRWGVKYIGTEHVLLAVARHPESGLSQLGVTERLDVLLSTAVEEWKRAHPPLTRRLWAAWCRLYRSEV